VKLQLTDNHDASGQHIWNRYGTGFMAVFTFVGFSSSSTSILQQRLHRLFKLAVYQKTA
jgi:hypothetical protein